MQWWRQCLTDIFFKAIEWKRRLTPLKETVKTGTWCGPKGKFLFFEFSGLQSFALDSEEFEPNRKHALLYFLPHFSLKLLIGATGVIITAQKSTPCVSRQRPYPFCYSTESQGVQLLFLTIKYTGRKLSCS